jgi:hypothetical protein
MIRLRNISDEGGLSLPQKSHAAGKVEGHRVPDQPPS